MILDFTISNFRSISEPQTISFEATNDMHLEDYYVVKKGNYRILKMAVILGANASGKSNVIRAFSMFPKLVIKPCKDKTSKIVYDKFALDKDFAEKDSVMVVNFICGEQKYRYEVHFNNAMVTYELLQRHPFGELRAHKVFERTTDVQSGVSTVKWGDKFRSNASTRALNNNLLHNRTVFGAYQNTNVDIPWMKEIVDWLEHYILPPVFSFEQHISDTISENLSDNLLDKNIMSDQLRKADVGVSHFLVDKETKDIPKEVLESIMTDEKIPSEVKDSLRETPTMENVAIRLVHNGKSCAIPFGFEEESGGTQRYYELSGVLLMLIKEPHFVAIDELECRLHPDLYEHYIATFLNSAKDSQILHTTHMREFLADRDMYRDDMVWFTEKSDEGATKLYSMVDFSSDVLRNSTNRYNYYRAGRLGAVPRLGDTYVANYNEIESDGKEN